MRQKLFILGFLFFFSLSATGQDKTVVDSLLQQVELSKADTSRVNTYLHLWYQYYRTDHAKAIEYAHKAKQLSGKIGYTDGLATAAYRLGTEYIELQDFDKAKIELNQSITLSKNSKDSILLASALSGLARIFRENAISDSATVLYLKALTIFEKTGDRIAVARIHNDLGNLNKSQHQYNKALVHYNKALEIVRQLDFLPGISACLNNIGGVYVQMEKHAEAIPYLEEALEIKVKTEDKLGEARALLGLGNIYRDRKDYNRANDYFGRTLELAKELSQSNLIAMARYDLGYNEFQKENYRLAIHYGELVATQENKGLNIIAKNQKMLAEAYAALHNYEKAFSHSMLFRNYSDSLYNEQREKLSNELEAKYQNEKNQKEIAALNATREVNKLKLQKGRNERNYLIGVSLLILLLGMVIWSRYRIKARTNRKLLELDQVKSRFFANISHEFRTPLTLILGPLRELQNKNFSGNRQAMYQIMQRNSQNLLHMVDQLLDISKIESDRMVLQAVKTDLKTFLKPVVASYSSLAQSKYICFGFRMEEDIALYLDHEKTEKILHNILSNAFKFTKAGGSISLVADTCHSKGKQWARINIQDTGIGISEKELTKIFDRFYQASYGHAQKYKGTGIGLALTKELVALHHGEIDVNSISGKGTCFTILLPLGKAHLSSGEIAAPPETVLTTEAKAGSTGVVVVGQEVGTITDIGTFPEHKTVSSNQTGSIPFLPQLLVVEDNPDMQDFLQHILQPYYKVTITSNGRNGLKKAKELQPDLVLSDVMMPKMDGLELCGRLKLDENTSHIPVILLTAKSGKQLKIEGLETGADDYLTKPFDADELLALLKNRIRQRTLLKERFSREVTLQPKDIAITSADERFLQKAMDIVENNMADSDFNVQAFIKQMGLGRSQIENKLKALTGQTPVEFMRLMRLKRAAQKIGKKEDSISQIAYSVGFNNLSYFSKCFKKQFGVSPSAWSGQSA